MPPLEAIPPVFEWQASALFWEREAQRFGELEDSAAETVAREKANACWRATAQAARQELARA